MAETIESLQARLGRYEADIDELQRQTAHAPQERRAWFADELQDLRVKQREAADHLARLRLQAAESWSDEDLQEGVFRVFDDIGRRIDHLFRRDT